VINGGIREGLAGDDGKKGQRLKHDVQPARELVAARTLRFELRTRGGAGELRSRKI
jgi:hypothetical protein